MRHLSVMPQSSLSILRFAVVGLALAVSACGPANDSQEEVASPAALKRSALLDDPCTETTTLPTLSYSGSTSIVLQCGDPWVAPVVTAVDACGNPIEVHKYNTGDDDGDGIPGSSDPDDFGPGPNNSVEGTYYVQYLAWDSFYNITGVVFDVTVVNCP